MVAPPDKIVPVSMKKAYKGNVIPDPDTPEG